MGDPTPRNFSSPDEVRTFDNGKMDILNLEMGTIGHAVFQPGWRWSKDVKPIAGTEWCEAPHFQYQLSGRLHVKMENGAELEIGPGEVVYLASGHDAWVVGDEPVEAVDWNGALNYAKK
jgi:hypothetical protein